MCITIVIATALLAILAAAQVPSGKVPWGPAGLIFPIRGSPLSGEQVEERWRQLPDGPSVTEILKSQIYRDSAGRVRIEWNQPDGSGKLSPVAYIMDPVDHAVVALLSSARIANREIVPQIEGHPFAVGLPAVGEPDPDLFTIPSDYTVHGQQK